MQSKGDGGEREGERWRVGNGYFNMKLLCVWVCVSGVLFNTNICHPRRVDKMRKSIFAIHHNWYIWFVHWLAGLLVFRLDFTDFYSPLHTSLSPLHLSLFLSIFRLILISLHTKANLIVSFILYQLPPNAIHEKKIHANERWWFNSIYNGRVNKIGIFGGYIYLRVACVQ